MQNDIRAWLRLVEGNMSRIDLTHARDHEDDHVKMARQERIANYLHALTLRKYSNRQKLKMRDDLQFLAGSAFRRQLAVALDELGRSLDAVDNAPIEVALREFVRNNWQKLYTEDDVRQAVRSALS
jgi:hypothetical protein